MKKIKTNAYAKINLSLIITNKRHDNYHNIKSIFQRISLKDKMIIKKTKSNELKLITNINELQNNNIINKAYDIIKKKYNISGLEVKLIKKIPMQSGLGGGSADCAAFLKGVDKLFNLKLTKNQYHKIGKELGADVVPCLYNEIILAKGIGDKITKIKSKFNYNLLVIKPNISFSTIDMYKKYDNQKNIAQHDNTDKIIDAIKNKNLYKLSNNLYNVFEECNDNKSLINSIKKDLIKNGAINSIMTGSGSAVYGIFENKKTAKKAYKKLINKYDIYLCKTI